MKKSLMLKIKMNDEENSYIRIIADVEKWHMGNGMLVVRLTNEDCIYILKEYIICFEEVRG